MNLNDYMRLQYLTVVREDQYSDGTPCYIAMHPQLSGCMSHGDTVEEAIQNLEDARREYIASLIEDNLDVPKPVTPSIGTGYKPTPSAFAVELTTSPETEAESSLKEWKKSAA